MRGCMRVSKQRLVGGALCLSALNLLYVLRVRDSKPDPHPHQDIVVIYTSERPELSGEHSSDSPSSNHTVPRVGRCSVSQRAHYVTQQCSKLNPNPKPISIPNLKHIFVDEKHKLLLCVPYKTGASTHLNLLARNSEQYLQGKYPRDTAEKMLNKLVDAKNRQSFGIRQLSSYNREQGKKVLAEYYKVAVVRHPLVRLLSMYMNKVASQVLGRWQCSTNYYGKYLIEYLKQHYSPDKQECTFTMFLEYLVSHQQQMLKDMHLYPMHSWCDFCQIQYDMIVRLETGDTDQEYLVHNKINPSFNQTLHINPALQTSQSRSESQDFEEVWEQYGGVSEQVLAQLEHMYDKDFTLFGYHYELQQRALQTRCSISTDSSAQAVCC